MKEEKTISAQSTDQNDFRQSQASSLDTAKRALAILEQQVAGHTSLTIPPDLQIKLEDKRREVANLERLAAKSPDNFKSEQLQIDDEDSGKPLPRVILQLGCIFLLVIGTAFTTILVMGTLGFIFWDDILAKEIESINATQTALANSSSSNPKTLTPTMGLSTRVPRGTLTPTYGSDVFFDDFEDGIDPAWQTTCKWIVSNGVPIIAELDRDNCKNMLLIGDSTWTRFAVEFDWVDEMDRYDRINEFGVSFGYGNPYYHYIYISHGHYCFVTKNFTDHTENIPGSQSDCVDVSPSHFRIEINASGVRLFVNDRKIN